MRKIQSYVSMLMILVVGLLMGTAGVSLAFGQVSKTDLPTYAAVATALLAIALIGIGIADRAAMFFALVAGILVATARGLSFLCYAAVPLGVVGVLHTCGFAILVAAFVTFWRDEDKPTS